VIVVVPAETPVTTPVEEPMVATAGVLDVQVPPGVASARVVVPVTQTVNVPVIGAVVAPGFTVKLFELMLKKILFVPFTLMRA
jgi:predicted cupin superfamily sugar epimerase